MTFSVKKLGFKIQLGQGSYGDSGFDTIEVPEGLWASARVMKIGSPSYSSADIQIAGLSLSVMNKLSRIGVQAAANRNNIVTVSAGDDTGALSEVFCGGIMESWPDFSNPTEAILKINANVGLIANMKPVKPTAYTGSTDVATIMKTLADQMGYTLENNGVSVQLSSPYLPGSARSQALAVAEAADIYVFFEDDQGVMVICPKDSSRNTPVPVISPAEQMNGYPSYIGPGSVGIVCEYNPQLRFLGNIKVQNSIVDGANGIWRVTNLLHDLSTRPDGPWFSEIQANNIPGGN